MTRGIRNNNPLNIRYACNNWLGKITKANKKDPSFEEFETMRHGFRAALLLIQNYIIKYGCNTISKIITRWAPPTDNNRTAKYIADVCKMVNMGGNEVLSNHDPRLKEIVRAMSLIESGTDIRDYWSALDVAWEEFKPKSVYQKERKPIAHVYK